MSETLIKNGLIIDGTGADPYIGNVLISGDRISAVEPLSASDNLPTRSVDTVIEARDLAVAPGFMDVHSHFDWALPVSHHPDFLYPMVEQGFTTVLTGNCGYSPAPVDVQSRELISRSGEIFVDQPLSYKWNSVREFLNYLESGNGLLFNNAQLVGHGSLHLVAVKDELRRPDPFAIARMLQMAQEAYDSGAFGLSMGLAYTPGLFSTRDELIALAKNAAKNNRILTVHMKALNRVSGAYPLIPFGQPHNLKALDETLSISLEAGVRLLLSHFAFVGRRSWPTIEKALAKIDVARQRGLDVMFDVYPVHAGNTYIRQVLPAWFIEGFEANLKSSTALKRLNLEIFLTRKLLGFEFTDLQVIDAFYPKWEKYNGLNMVEIADREGKSPFDAMVRLIQESNGKALLLFGKINGHADQEAVLERLLAHDLCMFETDAILTSRGLPNPAAYGAVPRILGRFVREKRVLTLAEAVAKMTGRPARWVGLEARGELKPNFFADLVVFDPETVEDTTTTKNPASKPKGIHKVFINGELVVDNGTYIKGRRPGRVLRAG